MNDIDAVLERLGQVTPASPIAADPAFPALLRASARRGGLAAAARSTATGLAMAAVIVLAHPLSGRADRAGVPLLTTASGVAL